MGRPRSLIPPCRFCDKHFKRREHLRRHERTHTHEKPFMCDCGRKFARQDMLARHHRLSHPERSDGPGVSTIGTASLALTDPVDPEVPHPVGYDSTEEPTFTGTENDYSLPLHEVMPQHQEQDGGSHFSSPHPAILTSLPPEEALGQSFLWDDNEDLEFLWNDVQPYSNVLPASFFDTTLSITDLSQQYSQASRPDQESGMGSRGVQEPLQMGRQLRSGTRDSAPGSPQEAIARPGRLFFESNENHDVHENAADNETDPSQNRRLEGNINPPVCPWNISPSDFESISREIKELLPILPPSFCLPSRHTLSRFLEGYFRGFHDHLPFLHLPSSSAVSLGPELILSLAAVGALYRFEHAKGYKLYRAARTLINWRLDHRNDTAFSRLTSTSPGYAGLSNLQEQSQASHTPQRNAAAISGPNLYGNDKLDLRLLQGLMVLMALTSWGDHAMVSDSVAMSGQAAMLAREIGITRAEPSTESGMSWECWVEWEERRRTLFVAYILFNLQCVAFNVPPMILNQEIALNLPACGEQWRAQNAQEWARIRATYASTWKPFKQIFEQLLEGNKIHTPDSISAFGNYVLIHGLVQEIFFARNTSSLIKSQSTGSLHTTFLKTMESALRSWQASWEATYESTLDPLSPKGPMGFNATALLRLAYIRLNANTGPNRQLVTRNPVEIAHGFTDGKTTVYARSPNLDRAILQCIHALSVPVRLGIPFIARTQTLNWSIQHSLCNIECAFLLNHWLWMIAHSIEVSGVQSIRDDERKLLNLILKIVREADRIGPSDLVDGDANAIRHLAASTVRLWAETFKGFHVFEISHVVGESLAIVADILDAKIESSAGG